MNKRFNWFGFKSFLILAFCTLLFTNVFAATSSKNYQLAAQTISKKIQSDLDDTNVSVKLTRVEEYRISKNQIGLTGDGVANLSADKKPIRFDVKVNTVNEAVSDVIYDFVEDASNYNPTSNEEVLMKELMNQIRVDYKTTNIVIALDAVENVGTLDGEKKFLGTGEVRVGDLVWKKIKFDVALDAATDTASKVVYKIEK